MGTPMTDQQDITCRGSIALGTACMKCRKCKAEISAANMQAMHAAFTANAEEFDSLLMQVLEENKRLHAELEKFLGDGSDYSRLALIKEIDKRDQELTSLYAQVEALDGAYIEQCDIVTEKNCCIANLQTKIEELSKYPEEAVRAVFGFLVDLLDEDGLRGDIHLSLLYSKYKDKLAAICKEKQGEGK